eukprot:1145911-Pelagomonas_calceolata.AAC.2
MKHEREGEGSRREDELRHVLRVEIDKEAERQAILAGDQGLGCGRREMGSRKCPELPAMAGSFPYKIQLSIAAGFMGYLHEMLRCLMAWEGLAGLERLMQPLHFIAHGLGPGSSSA